MAYLKFNGTGFVDNVNLTVLQNLVYRIEIGMAVPTFATGAIPSEGQIRIQGRDANDQAQIYISSNDRLSVRYGANASTIHFDGLSLSNFDDGLFHAFIITRDGSGNTNLTIDGTPYGGTIVTTTIGGQATRLGFSGILASAPFDLYYYRAYNSVDTLGTLLAEFDGANITTNTSIFTDTSPTPTDGNLINLPTDGSQWGGLVIADTTIPVINVDGQASTTIKVGDPAPTFIATASDNIDGDITANIVVGGDTVDPNIVGTYVITYNVSDAALNAATQVTRTVIVEALALNMTLNGIPDGIHTTFYMNLANNTMASAEVTWTSNAASFPNIAIPFGTEVVYGAIGASNGGLQRGTIS